MNDKDITVSKPSDEGSDLEEIAALIDGRLEGEERARVIARLAQDEASYEVFAEVLALQEEPSATEAPAIVEVGDETEDAEVVSMDRAELRGGPARPWNRWLPTAPMLAAAVLTAIVGIPLQQGWILPKALRADGLLTEALRSERIEARGLDEEWYRGGKRNTRGVGAASAADRIDFQLGVQSIDLHVALTFDDLEQAKLATDRILNLLDDDRGLYVEQTEYRLFLESLGSAPDLSALLDESSRLEARLEESVAGLYFDFGLWLEAARLATLAGEVDFFRHRKTRRMLRRLDQGGLTETAESLRQLCTLAAESGLDEKAAAEVAGKLDAIARRFGALL